jgi:hypothetical protein
MRGAKTLSSLAVEVFITAPGNDAPTRDLTCFRDCCPLHRSLATRSCSIRSSEPTPRTKPLNETCMADQIVITEKTSQAKDVRAAVGSRYGDILPAERHLLDLLESEDVVPAWRRWAPILLRLEGLYATRPAEGGNKAAKLKAKDERDEQESLLDLSEPWRAPACRKQRQRSAKPATNFRCRKFDLTALQSTFDEFNPPSMNSTIGRARRAEAIRRASTSVAGPIRCEPRSRWPSSGRREPPASCRA